MQLILLLAYSVLSILNLPKWIWLSADVSEFAPVVGAMVVIVALGLAASWFGTRRLATI